MREDIYGAIKNALERGETIEEAIQSLINSGYNSVEVKETAQEIVKGTLTGLSLKPPTKISSDKKEFKSLPIQEIETKKPSQRRPKKIIILVVILLVLVGILIATILLREQFINFLTDLF